VTTATSVFKLWSIFRLKQLNDSTVIVSALETFRTNPTSSLKEIARFYEPIEYMNEKGQKTRDLPNKYFLMLQAKNTNDLRFDTFRPDRVAYAHYSHWLCLRRDERDWRKWVDDKFIHAISPNVYRTLSESYQVFQWFDKRGDWEKEFTTLDRYMIQYAGILVMYLISKGLKSKLVLILVILTVDKFEPQYVCRYKLKDDVRESFYDYAKEWRVAVGSQFRGGEVPNLADLVSRLGYISHQTRQKKRKSSFRHSMALYNRLLVAMPSKTS
jgi:microsomal prostaglandin-E synthase 2